MKGKMALVALVAATSVALISCIGIESHVTFNRDGSGVLKVEYRVAKSLANLGKEGASKLPLPVDEQELRQAVSEVKGLKLVGVTRREDEKDIFISAEIGFERIESVAQVEGFADMPMSLERSGDGFVFHQLISAGRPEQPAADPAVAAAAAKPAEAVPAGAPPAGAESDKELAAMFAGLFEGYELVFAVSAPAPIKQTSAGELSADRRTVTYRLPLGKMMELTQETSLTVTW